MVRYANDQRAATLWYLDHSLGMTRLNVYAGPPGFYLLRGGPAELTDGILPGPAPDLDDPPGLNSYEIPIATGQVMKFTVVPLSGADTSLSVEQLELPVISPAASPIRTRKVSLNEEVSACLQDVGPREALLGTMDAFGNPVGLMWSDPVTENPRLNDTEIWEIYNFTADAHPIHIHQTQFQVVNRQALVADEEGISPPPARLLADPFPAEPWETGFKDTVIAYPGQITRLSALFDIPGQFVWHCHIVEHEDNEMMRPRRVGP